MDRTARRWYERLLLVQRVYRCGRCRKRVAIWPWGRGRQPGKSGESDDATE